MKFIFSWKCYLVLLAVGLAGFIAVPYLDEIGRHNEIVEIVKIFVMALVMAICIYFIIALGVACVRRLGKFRLKRGMRSAFTHR